MSEVLKMPVNQATSKALADYLVRHLEIGAFVSEVSSMEQVGISSDGQRQYKIKGRTDLGVPVTVTCRVTPKDEVDENDLYPISSVLMAIKWQGTNGNFVFFNACRSENRKFVFTPVFNSFEMS